MTPQGWQEIGKRALDITLSTSLLVLIAPALATLALAIRLDSAGPALSRQKRVGRHGRPFAMYGLRTTTGTAGDASRGTMPTAPPGGTNAIRVTRIGRRLRRAGIDGLPRLLNVVRGDMSLVGPRPMTSTQVEQLQGWQHERHHVRPGITGMSQVCRAGCTSLEDQLRLDIAYVRTRSLGTDLRLMLARMPKAYAGPAAR